MKKDWDGKTVREEGENVCVGTGAGGLQDLQDPPVPTAEASATFSLSQGKRHPFKQVSSTTPFYIHQHSSHTLCSRSSFSGFSRAAIGTRSGIGCSWIAPCPCLILRNAVTSLSCRVWDFWAVITVLSKPCEWLHCHIRLHGRCVVKCPASLGETQRVTNKVSIALYLAILNSYILILLLLFWYVYVEIRCRLPVATGYFKETISTPSILCLLFFFYKDNLQIGKLIPDSVSPSVLQFLEGVSHQIKAQREDRYLNTSISISRIPVKVIISILFPVADPSTEAAINWKKKSAMETRRSEEHYIISTDKNNLLFIHPVMMNS